jgi:flagellar hook-length control protein FliK
MSILSSSLTGEFIRAAASGARARGADPATGGASFRDRLDAARDDRRSELATDESDAADASTRDAHETDAATEDQAADDGGDRERTDADDRRRDAAEAEAADTDAAPDIRITTIDAVLPASSATDVTAAGTDQFAAAEGALTSEVDPRAAGLGDAAVTGATTGDAPATATWRSGGPDVTRADAAAAAGPVTSPTGTAAGGGSTPTSATADPRQLAGTPATGRETLTDAAPTTKDAGREGGAIRLEGVRATAETTIDRSAYRSAMADRAAGRDLAPAERQALALDQRIAQARAEAAARSAGTRGPATADGGSAVAASGGLAGGGAAAARRGAGLGSAGATSSATNAAATAPATAAHAGPVTTTAPAPANANAPVDLGVAARPGPAPAPGVPAAVTDGGAAAAGRGAGDPPALAQALRGARMLVGRDGGTMTVRLNPGDLGDLRVRVDIRGGRVTADFQTTTDAAREQIERGMDTLRRGLEERGLQVERLTVRTAESDSGRGPRTDDSAGRDRGANANAGGDGQGGGGGRDDAAGRESDGRQHEHPARRPIGERASTPDALRAFASIFGEQTQ